MVFPAAKGRGVVQILALELEGIRLGLGLGRRLLGGNGGMRMVQLGIGPNLRLCMLGLVVLDFELDDNLVARGIRVVVVFVLAGKFVARIVIISSICVRTVFLFVLVFLEAHNPPVEFSADHALALFDFFRMLMIDSFHSLLLEFQQVFLQIHAFFGALELIGRSREGIVGRRSVLRPKGIDQAQLGDAASRGKLVRLEAPLGGTSLLVVLRMRGSDSGAHAVRCMRCVRCGGVVAAQCLSSSFFDHPYRNFQWRDKGFVHVLGTRGVLGGIVLGIGTYGSHVNRGDIAAGFCLFVLVGVVAASCIQLGQLMVLPSEIAAAAAAKLLNRNNVGGVVGASAVCVVVADNDGLPGGNGTHHRTYYSSLWRQWWILLMLWKLSNEHGWWWPAMVIVVVVVAVDGNSVVIVVVVWDCRWNGIWSWIGRHHLRGGTLVPAHHCGAGSLHDGFDRLDFELLMGPLFQKIWMNSIRFR